MSSVQLLDKTRKIGKLLHNNNSSKVVFNDICRVMREILKSNCLVISKKGKVISMEHPIHMRKIIFPHRKVRIFRLFTVLREQKAGSLTLLLQS